MRAKKDVVVIGGGGHAKVVISTLQAAGYQVAAALDEDSNKWGREVLGVPVLGPVSEIEEGRYENGVIAVGNNSARKGIVEKLNLRWVTVIHPAAYVHPSVRLGDGTVVFAGAVIQPDCHIGDHVIVNTWASIDHDCRVADFAHIAPGAHLAGDVRVGEGAFMGIGSAINPGISIGQWTTVGAGGVVVGDLPERVVAMGVPAKPRRKVEL